jgi:thiamine pyrophosphate-dependent acetolactate synthase large subunit-like protein
MGMGILVTIAEQQPKNFYHFMLDNEVYATTGGQPVPNANAIQYQDVARACGYTRTYAYDNLETFSINVERILGETGPVFVALKVKPDVENTPIGGRVKWRKRSQVQVVADLKKELGIAS